ncbi:MAG: hypothetical protein PUC25_07385, partial [Prevotellaceae bacterium]|nr:hypothetical protein [Prevotellaceae bacterium]
PLRIFIFGKHGCEKGHFFWMFSCFPNFFAVPLHKRNEDNRRASRTRLEGISKPYTTFCLTFNTIYTMAKITTIGVIKGISGKYGGNSNDYF